MSDVNFDKNGTGGINSSAGKDLAIGLGSTGFIKVVTNGGALQLPTSNPAEGTAATTLASSGTIDTTIGWQRVITAGAVTGVILEAGTVHGQICIVTSDKDSAGSITMAAAGTSRVGSGTACIIIAGGGRIFIWDNTDAIWLELGDT